MFINQHQWAAVREKEMELSKVAYSYTFNTGQHYHEFIQAIIETALITSPCTIRLLTGNLPPANALAQETYRFQKTR